MKPKIPLPSPRLSMWHAKTNKKGNGGARSSGCDTFFTRSPHLPTLLLLSSSAVTPGFPWLEPSQILLSEGIRRKPTLLTSPTQSSPHRGQGRVAT